ncbi:MAG: 3-hydroxy-3-methylglutaryl CoA synthase [Chloroflexi bacterium]|nr:MAG: 3-hydroxy-3-methylglutaryl CoA synthase [Chloroflexota bacterium]
MVGITSYGAYIPWHRMKREDCVKAWGGFAMPGERAVAYYDEDSVTMAVEAAMDCLTDLDSLQIDGLFFATTSSSYKEKQCAAVMAWPLNLRRDIRTADVNTSLRSGTTALALAADAVRSGTANSILVAAADCRVGAPAGMLEQQVGDGAAALLVGKENVIAEILDYYSIADELTGVWRSYDDTFLRSWEDRMVLDEGYSKIVPEVMNGLLKKCGLSPKDIAKVVFDPPGDPRRHGRAAASAGFDPAQVQDPFALFLNVGLTGCAMAPMMLVAALEEAKPGDKILFVGSGDGADAFLIQVTEAITKLGERRGIKKNVASKRVMSNYNDYLRWREIVPLEAARRPEKQHIRLSANWRERKQLLGLWGIKCRQCGTPQYDNGAATTGPIRVCASCHAQDDFDDYCFARRKATIFSYTQDNLAPVIDPPASVVLVEFEGGGRAFFDLTDRDPAMVQIGMPVEMTFRKLQHDRGLTNYFWKARPIR